MDAEARRAPRGAEASRVWPALVISADLGVLRASASIRTDSLSNSDSPHVGEGGAVVVGQQRAGVDRVAGALVAEVDGEAQAVAAVVEAGVDGAAVEQDRVAAA